MLRGGILHDVVGRNIRVAGPHVDDDPTADISGSVTAGDGDWGLLLHRFGDGLDAMQDAAHVDSVEAIELVQRGIGYFAEFLNADLQALRLLSAKGVEQC